MWPKQASERTRDYDFDRDNEMHPDGIVAETFVNDSEVESSSYSVGDGGAMAADVLIKREAEMPLSRNLPSSDVWKELCVICGDRASGFHYNAFSCEGCKGFFRRSITRNATYECKYGGNCEMDMWMRRRCQACRLKRCREVGMREDCLLSEGQCKVRDARRKAKQRMHPSKSGSCTPSSSSSVTRSSSLPCTAVGLSSLTLADNTGDDMKTENLLDQLTKEQKELVEKLVVYQDQYELPTEDSIATLSNMRFIEYPGSENANFSDAIFRRMAEMTILTTHLVIEFAKHLPGFLSLEKDDKIVLLKGSASEVMMLRTARRYDPLSDTVVFGDGTPFTRESLRFGGLEDYVEDMFEFAQKMAILEVDNSEYALLTAICIFSDRPGLTNTHQTESLQEVMIDTLTVYMQLRRPRSRNSLARLLMRLVDLRTLSSRHSKRLHELKVEKGSLPPLLIEYFDIFD